MTGKSFENPLLSHARMRGLYRSMVELRAARLLPRGLEAPFAASAIDLQPTDFALSTQSARAIDHVRALGSRTGNGAPRPAGIRKLLAGVDARFAGTAGECVLCAAGAAMGAKAGEGKAVAVALIGGKDLPPAAWIRILRVSGAAELPLIVVALPGGSRTDWAGAGRRSGLPVIPVDAADAVALYRVVQECVVRARADRRGAVIECVPSKADPVRMMGEQLVAKGSANERWVASVPASFAEVLAQAK